MSPAIEIPTLPVARMRALSLIANPDPSYDDMARLVDTDPALTVALLRAANSAASAPVDRVRTAHIALVRVGVKEARRIIMSVALSQSFRGLNRSKVDELWRHLIATAVLADATAWGEVRHAEAFTAGLLHDVGRLVMAAGEPERYARVVDLARQGTLTAEAERTVMGVDHVEWGQTLAQSWGFPDEIIEAISDHHAGTQHGISWVVTRAREMAGGLGIGDGLIAAEPLDLNSEAAMLPVVDDLGGADAVLQRVGWYQGAMAAAAA
jgi:putative nucleotidyltransferase with HDIG domain